MTKKIFYLGPTGSFSETIAKKALMQPPLTLVPCNTFLDIVNDTIFSSESLGVLPIENSITSDIHENIDFLFKNDLYIVQEAFLKINLHVIGLKKATLSEITKIYSHPRALAQCTDFIKQHGISTVETPSTSAAKQLLLSEKNTAYAAIGSTELLTDSSLVILEKNIGNTAFNLTRFVIISKEQHALSKEGNKTTILFNVKHTPGSLAKILNEIAKFHLNLTKIESRPIPGTNWEYQFWIDIENAGMNLDMAKISDLFFHTTTFFKIVGVYQTGKMYQS